MGSAGNQQTPDEWNAQYRKFQQGGGLKRDWWADLSPSQQQQAAAKGYTRDTYNAEGDKNATNSLGAGVKAQLGDNLTDENGNLVNGPPRTPDLTDEAVQKARTSYLLRLGATRGRNSTFSSTPGSFTLSKDVLGGY